MRLPRHLLAGLAGCCTLTISGAAMARQTAPDPAPDAAPAHTNRLAESNSPYLLQHAHNPVDWYPWGPEAFEAARERGVPIFLSVGYSTCYWCHVMERESFEDPALAAFLNERFVAIKVDREQRPDVDRIYMEAVTALTGRGGWPMSVFLTPPGARGEGDPGLEPFWGGTYFPPEPRMGMPSFRNVLEAMHGAWTERREDVLTQAASVTQAIRAELESTPPPVRLGPQQVAMAANGLLSIFDATEGGFGGAPKFPQPAILDFLLTARPYTDGEKTRDDIDSALRATLDAMALGGIYDQVGGGFHRYSVDAMWRVPHFEKMLYDNAQLAATYARAARMYADPYYGRIARETADYVLREMTSDRGLFFSAQDAEVDGREGRGYVWTAESLAEVLEGDDLAFAKQVYNLDAGPNFRDPHHPSEPATNVLYLSDRPMALAREMEMDANAFRERLDRIDAALLAARNQQKRPATDDKIIAGWNGLMIDGLAQTALPTGDTRYLDAAERAARALLENYLDASGDLHRIGRTGDIGGDALLEDYAYLVRGLLSAYQVRRQMSPDADAAWLLEGAIRLTGHARQRFWDGEAGAWFDTRPGQTDLLVRPRTVDDGAVPSGQGVMLHNLLTLAEITGEEAFVRDAGRTLEALSAAIAEHPVRTINATGALARVMAEQPQLFESFAFGSAPTLSEQREQAAAEQPVQVFSDVDRVTVPAQGAAVVTLRFRIADGYHMNAPDPGVEGLTGLSIDIEGASGLEATPEYPEPELYEGVAVNPASDQRLMVYTGEIEVPVRIARSGAFVAGQGRLRVTWQVCTDTECLAPMSGALDVAIEAE
jgi:uncharacterized protein YyaL (SSP411 family)